MFLFPIQTSGRTLFPYYRQRLFLRQDEILLLPLICGFETLPWETTLVEVEKHVS